MSGVRQAAAILTSTVGLAFVAMSLFDAMMSLAFLTMPLQDAALEPRFRLYWVLWFGALSCTHLVSAVAGAVMVWAAWPIVQRRPSLLGPAAAVIAIVLPLARVVATCAGFNVMSSIVWLALAVMGWVTAGALVALYVQGRRQQLADEGAGSA